MLKTETRTVEAEMVVDVLCNKCGRSQLQPPPEIQADLGGGIVSVDAEWIARAPRDVYGLPPTEVSSGYFSPVFSDGVRYKFSLCEWCLKELFDTFEHPPETEEYAC